MAVRYTAALAGADEITVMLLDVLSGLPELKLCTAYELDGERRTHFPSDAFELERCQPVYETMPGWTGRHYEGPQADRPAGGGAAVHRPHRGTGRPESVGRLGRPRPRETRSRFDVP